jgi:uncharacterized protein (DUF1778 family)
MAKTNQLMVRLDEESKAFVTKAAELRKVSISDYVRIVAVGQARREVDHAEQNTIALSPAEQLAFWNALNTPPQLSKSQYELGRLMRGEQ